VEDTPYRVLSVNQLLGQMVDYELPLQEEEDATYGAVDLLAVDKTTLRLIEVKTARNGPRSGDGLLRALLEVYTYYNALLRTPEETKARLVRDFAMLACHPPVAYHFEPVVMVERESCAGWQLSCINEYPYFRELVRWIQDEHQMLVHFYCFDYPARYTGDGNAFCRDQAGRINLVGPLAIERSTVVEGP
jgi:hypothetical protein